MWPVFVLTLVVKNTCLGSMITLILDLLLLICEKNIEQIQKVKFIL